MKYYPDDDENADDGPVGAIIKCVLKVCNNYHKKDIEAVSDVLLWLHHRLYTQCCRTLPTDERNDDARGRHVCITLGDDRPAILIMFVEGVAADNVAKEAPAQLTMDPEDASRMTSEPTVLVPVATDLLLEAVGSALAGMHAVGVPGCKDYLEGGCCEVQNHIDGTFDIRLTKCGYNDVSQHNFVSFYQDCFAHVTPGDVARRCIFG